MIEGVLDKMAVRPDTPARYAWVVQAGSGEGAAIPAPTPMNDWVGGGLRIEFLERIRCSHCAAVTARSYGGGYCYECFRALARCDLCVVSPDRCHFHLGTCREPAWGEAFCMQPHLVYLANSSGPKVGLTSDGASATRWLDQGATQGLVIARAATRHLAGVLEAGLARLISDRTDWRRLVQADADPVDLPVLRERLRARLGDLPDGVTWCGAEPVTELSYPVRAYPRRVVRLRLDRHPVVAGNLLGIKGQYLLFEHGAFNVRWHRGFEARVTPAAAGEAVAAEPRLEHPDESQMELFP